MHKQSGFSHILIPLVIVVAFVVAAGLFVQNRHNSNKTLGNQETASTISETLPGSILPVDKIKELASQKQAGKTVSALALVKEHSNYIYKVRMDDGTVLVFNAVSGDQLNRGDQDQKEDEQEFEGDGDLPDNFKADVTFDQARSLALDAHAGTIDSIELEGEGHSVVYKVEFTDDARVMINAVTGKVLNVKLKTKHGKHSGSSEAKTENSSTSSKHKNSSSNDSNDDGDTHSTPDESCTGDNCDSDGNGETESGGGSSDGGGGGSGSEQNDH